ncbi:MAG: Nif11-like leader peptide family RiPP precursor [Rhodospirillaceae bacterium]
MSNDLIEFYRAVRGDDALRAKLSAIIDPEEAAEAIMAEARARNFAVSAEDITAALSDFGGFLKAAVNDDELNDDELELVAAGSMCRTRLHFKDGELVPEA